MIADWDGLLIKKASTLQSAVGQDDRNTQRQNRKRGGYTAHRHGALLFADAEDAA